ncbi:hypothetical protein BKA65DRAFT_272059 [Rhexocercosporidium sp. MPI-PUGE-AT-0058]|nr:hypothetical protein BKA65DRAFT_272059 [Rhexocercosporidium sp. MPI-PUGE-AT-0058]
MLKADVNEFPVLCDLYQPKAHDNLVDLVFVHGLGGTFRGTWTADGAPRPWIENPEFLGPLKDKVRILSFGYNANRFGEVANTRIIHHANSLLRALFRKRIDCQERPIIFIAHSLGGLVVKRAILLCPTNDDWHAIKSATKGVVFMGTPHMGAEQANYLSLAQNFLSLVKLEQPVATNLTKELELFSTTMQDINQEFSIDVHRSIKLICFYESVPQRLPHGKSVITDRSAVVCHTSRSGKPRSFVHAF